MTERPKLRATLVQTFGTPCLTDSVRSSFGPVDRSTEPGGTEGEMSKDALPGDGEIVGDCYRLVRRLGEGMFGRVYLAERTDVPEHRVALKVINRAVYAGRNVERELVMLAAATHPHIVQLKDHGMTPDYVWLTMPLYEGETLQERLDRGPLTPEQAHAIFVPIARGVQALHARGLRHQDIKPDNIFLADFEDQVHPVLLDLGVAVECNATFVAGTALFAAPEQIVALGGLPGRSPLGEKMDVYCLATTLLRSLVSEEQFPGNDAKSPFEIANAFAEREAAPLREDAIPALRGEPRQRLIHALGRWLTQDADKRPSADQLVPQLEVLLEREREAERLIAQNLRRQESGYRRVKIALGAIAMLTMGGLAFGVSKRETFRLAAELQAARAAGAASFDKLDTCAAAHEVAREQATQCATEASISAENAAAHLSATVSNHAESADALTRKLSLANTSATNCERAADETAAAFNLEREELAGERRLVEERLETQQAAWAQERGSLETKRDAFDEARRQCETKLATASDQKNRCDERIDSVQLERDACLLALPSPAAKSSAAGPAAAKAKTPIESKPEPTPIEPVVVVPAVAPSDTP
jgi:eukaryotic-like serine/threonine-protein kinase